MSDWGDFLDLDNFGLAWERILRSNHYHNKDRIGLRVYSANLDVNLEHLVDRVKENIYKPNPAESIYIPKPSGGVRSLPFLCIEDRIVYQAIANVIAKKSKASFEAIVRWRVFAHLLGDPDDVFMLRQWRGPKGQYLRFLNRFRELLQRGYRWVVEADIAAYYDSIDHHLFSNRLRSEYLDGNELVELLERCLRAWTPHEDGPELARGLPQGYEASDYLATLFLLPVDKQLILRSAHYCYIRYVDDFRILAQDRGTAQKALVELDVALKKQTLILKGAKTSIREAADINRETERLARKLSMLSILEQRKAQTGHIGRELIFLFHRSWRTLKEGQDDKHAETRLIFAMNRMPSSKLTRKIALDMLREMPWRSRDVTSYLSRFRGNTEVIAGISEELRAHTAYPWHLANCMRALSEISGVDVYRSVCQDWISNMQLPWCQRLAAVESLRHDPESYSFLLLKYEQESNYLVRRKMLVAAMLAASTNGQRALVIRTGMKDKHPQIIATAVWLFLEFPECGVSEEEFGEEIGVHRRMLPAFAGSDLQGACYIKATLSERFDVNIPHNLDFRLVFESAYEQGVVHLHRAISHYYTDPDTFVTCLSNFNQVVTIRMNEVFGGNSKIPPDQYDQILKSSKFRDKYGAIAVHFLECYKLRKESLGPHAWAASRGTWSRSVTYQERDKLIKDLRASYQQFTDAFADEPNTRP